MSRKKQVTPIKPLYLLIAVLLIFISVACTKIFDRSKSIPNNTSVPQPSVLNIWWDKGYVLEEDESLEKLIRDWEKRSRIPVNLSFYTPDEITQKALRAVQSGNPPDILFASRAEYPRLAWQGLLADVSEVVEPSESIYVPSALQAAYLYNNIEEKRSYYAVPLHQATIHIFYWKDLLEQAKLSTENLPQEWDAFWQVWKTAQDSLKTSQNSDIYGLGLPMSVGASDTYYIFEQILEAYNVQILDAKGQLQLDDPTTRQKIINCLDWYTQFYQQKYIPPTATQWLDPDNNRNLFNRVVVMTPNPTLSIPVALRQDTNASQKLGIVEFPNKPSNQPMRHLVSIRQAVVFSQAENPTAAKQFLTYLITPEILENYLKSAGGRYLPALVSARKDPFWTDSNNSYLLIATKTLMKGQTRLFYSVQNPAYSLVLEENVWGQALTRIVVDGISLEQAADEAIKRIQEIFQDFD